MWRRLWRALWPWLLFAAVVAAFLLAPMRVRRNKLVLFDNPPPKEKTP